ncbi:MAG: SRPBCC domain-containing protein [Microbacteriaceae bacterium]|nr:SRPBCC domain-containing protein [Microbacteriaceae bacterium]
MVDIRHRIGIEAPAEQVYRALATPEGVAGWWSTDTTGDARELQVRFGDAAGFDLAVARALPREQVQWEVTAGPAEWLGTTIAFDLRADGEVTIVLFTHSGWRQPTEYLHECSTQWAVFLLSLKSLLETGAGQPWPHGVDIHNLP